MGSDVTALMRGWQSAAEAETLGKVVGYALGNHLGYTWEAGLLMRREPDNGQARLVAASTAEVSAIAAAIEGGYFTVYHSTKDEEGNIQFKVLHEAATHPQVSPTAGIAIPRTPPILASWSRPDDLPNPKIHRTSRSRAGRLEYVTLEAQVRGAEWPLPHYLIHSASYKGGTPRQTEPVWELRRKGGYPPTEETIAYALTYRQALSWAKDCAFADCMEMRRLLRGASGEEQEGGEEA